MVQKSKLNLVRATKFQANTTLDICSNHIDDLDTWQLPGFYIEQWVVIFKLKK